MKNALSRRDFLCTSVAGIAASNIVYASESDSKTDSTDSRGMKGIPITRKLGDTGIILPVVNMGVMNSGNPDLVKRSYELGVRHFDTAAYYQRGRNEQMVGQAIKDLGVREEVIIGTKVFLPHQRRDIPDSEIKEFFLETANDSLKRLQTEYVDILYSHNVSDIEYLNNPGVLEALNELKQAGKTRFIGFTTHSNMAACINNAATSGSYDVFATAFNYAMADDNVLHDALTNASSAGIGIIAMKTQCAQYWYRQYIPQSDQSFYEGSIMHTAVLKWVLRHPFITTAIPGYTTFQQMNEDLPVAYDLEYTPDEKRFLEDRDVRLSLGYCRQCRDCVDRCPHGVDVPTLMRAHLYAFCYPNPHESTDALRSIPPGKGLDTCKRCGSCSVSCSRDVNIRRRIEELIPVYC